MTFDVPAIKNRCNELKRMPRAQRRNGNSNVVPIDLGRNFCDPGSDQSWRQCKLGELRVRPANAEQKSYGALPFSLRRRSGIYRWNDLYVYAWARHTIRKRQSVVKLTN